MEVISNKYPPDRVMQMAEADQVTRMKAQKS